MRARSLLALACAALMLACASAAGNILPACKTLLMGTRNGFEIPFEDILLTERASNEIYFPDMCGRRGWSLQGTAVTACGAQGPPAPRLQQLVGPLDGASRVLVSRADSADPQTVEVHSKQYCEIPKDTHSS